MISYDQWMKDTHSLLNSRSDLLKQVDAAIKTQDTARVKTALDRWRFEQSKQGKDWRKSVRNGKGAVTKLHRDVNGLDKRQLTPEELEAMTFIAREQALALMKQFEGRKLTFKSTTLVGMAKGAGSRWERFKTGASNIASGGDTVKSLVSGVQDTMKGASLLKKGGKAAVTTANNTAVTSQFAAIKEKVRTFCKDLCPGIDPEHIFKALNLGGVEHFVQTVTPFIGAISSGGKAVIAWGKVAATGYNHYKVKGSRYAFSPGDPEAALDAVIKLLEREIASGSAKAGVKTVAFTGKLLGSFADAGAVTGPIVGLIELLAEIFQAIVEYVIEYKECKAGNAMLKVGALNLELFGVCPILGCYFLCMQDHSTIINFAVGEYGTPNWMFDVEKLVAKIQTALDKARQYISAARYEIVGFENAKGTVDAKWSHKGTLGKITGAPEAIQEKIMDRIESWFTKPTKPPKVDPSRIVGFGSN